MNIIVLPHRTLVKMIHLINLNILYVLGPINDNCVIISQEVLHLNSLNSILVTEVSSKFKSTSLGIGQHCPSVPHQHLLQNSNDHTNDPKLLIHNYIVS